MKKKFFSFLLLGSLLFSNGVVAGAVEEDEDEIVLDDAKVPAKLEQKEVKKNEKESAPRKAAVAQPQEQQLILVFNTGKFSKKLEQFSDLDKEVKALADSLGKERDEKIKRMEARSKEVEKSYRTMSQEAQQSVLEEFAMLKQEIDQFQNDANQKISEKMMSVQTTIVEIINEAIKVYTKQYQEKNKGTTVVITSSDFYIPDDADVSEELADIANQAYRLSKKNNAKSLAKKDDGKKSAVSK